MADLLSHGSTIPTPSTNTGGILDAGAVEELGVVAATHQDPASFFVGDIDICADPQTGTSEGWYLFPPIPEEAELVGLRGCESPGLFLKSPEPPDACSAELKTEEVVLSERLAYNASPFPRPASMPNLRPLDAEDKRKRAMGESLGQSLLINKSSASASMSRSFSTSDISALTRYGVPHASFLTPPHMRKGKGGRQPAIDPRLDPRIDPKKARRILANRLSAAKSKLKQKSAAEGLRHRLEMLRLQRDGLLQEMNSLEALCSEKVNEQERLRTQISEMESLLRQKTRV